MKVEIRGECITDYPRIAELNALAFGRMGEAILVDMLRHDARFDPELSLVAVVDGQIAGHALYVVYAVQVGGQIMPAAELAPLAVHPDFQRRGLGMALLREAHSRLAARGVQFGFLLGHDSYYPRLGYRTNMFGQVAIDVSRHDVRHVAAPWSARPVARADIPTLLDLWRLWFADVDLARLPGASITDWASCHPMASSIVLVDDRDVVQAYLRYRPDRACKPWALLARDGAALAQALDHLATQCAPEIEDLTLPLHPGCAAAQSMLLLPWRALTKLWSAAMILPLTTDNAALNAYMAEVTSGQRLPGLQQETAIFDLFF